MDCITAKGWGNDCWEQVIHLNELHGFTTGAGNSHYFDDLNLRCVNYILPEFPGTYAGNFNSQPELE